MPKYLLIIIVPLLSLTFFSCQREPMNSEPTVTDVIIDPPQESINGSVMGIITGNDGEPLANASVSYNGKGYVTDINGSFSIPQGELFRDGTFVTVHKDGFFNGSRTFYPIENEHTNIRIELINRNELGSFKTTQGGKVFIDEPNDAYVEFPAGQYLDSDGALYNGDIQVSGVWMDPNKETTYYRMPGDLNVLTSDKKIIFLSPITLI